MPDVELVADDADGRRKLIRFTDPDRAYRHLPAIKEVFERPDQTPAEASGRIDGTPE